MSIMSALNQSSSHNISTRENQSRWGMLPKAAELSTVKWEDFDHSQTLHLGYSTTTRIVFKFTTLDPVLLKSCKSFSYTDLRGKLVEIAKTSQDALFLETKCVFSYRQDVYVGSELSDMSLEDIIDCTIPLQEVHLSSILYQVYLLPRCGSSQPLKYLDRQRLKLPPRNKHRQQRLLNLWESPSI